MGRRMILVVAILAAMVFGVTGASAATTFTDLSGDAVAGAADFTQVVVSNDLDELARATRRLLDDPEYARERGRQARAHALAHYGLEAFLQNWNTVFADAVESHTRRRRSRQPLLHPQRSFR